MRRSLAIAVLVGLHASLVTAQTTPTTRLIPYSGAATDAAGSPMRGTVTLVFELHEDHEGGTPLWQETQQVQLDGRGRYLAYLGAVTSFPQTAFAEERARWLAVTIDGRASPRVMLVAVPYALRAADADTLGGQPASAFVRKRADGRLEATAGAVALDAVDGSGVPGQLAKFSSATSLSSSIISESATNRIGVGLPDPTGGGVVDSVFTIRNFDNNTGFAVLNQGQARRFALNTLTNGGWKLYDGGSGGWNEGITQQNGRIGLGISNPDARLRVITTTSIDGVYATQTTANATAIRGVTNNGNAIMGITATNDPIFSFGGPMGVVGYSGSSGVGVFGNTVSGAGVLGISNGITAADAGIYGQTSTAATAGRFYSSGIGLAGHFTGNVTITGVLSKGGGSFTIDHPLDPTNKLLSHSFVESPDMMNVYNGNVVLDASGEAWVTLPEWFEALNRDFRYQLTAIGAPGPNLYVAAKVSGNRFKIAGGVRGGEVSWQVTGIRQDAWANAHRIAVEEEKPVAERGSYLHPKEHGQPVSAGPLQAGARNNPQ